MHIKKKMVEQVFAAMVPICAIALMAMVPIEVFLRGWQQTVYVTTIC